MRAIALKSWRIEYNGFYKISNMSTKEEVGTFTNLSDCKEWFMRNTNEAFAEAICGMAENLK